MKIQKSTEHCVFTCFTEDEDWNFLTLEDDEGHEFFLYPEEALQLYLMLNGIFTGKEVRK